MENWNPDCDYAIFDDISGGLLAWGGSKDRLAYKSWLGGQHMLTMSDKYAKRRTILWGRPSISLSNTNPLLEHGVDVEWLLANCTIVHVTSVIARYKTST